MILEGWKDVAKHLGCGVRTAQRWERLGMPVRRPGSGRRSAVLAISEELDAWLNDFAPGGRPPSHKASSQRFPYRILIADDDERLLVELGARLAREGHAVRTARDGFEALTAMRDGVPDLVISELKMPNMSGFELLSVIRRRFPAVAVIAMSGEFSPAAAPNILCDRYIQKGQNSRFELVEAVRELLAESPLRGQAAKVGSAPAWIPQSTRGYIVLSCITCLRSFSLMTRNAATGKDTTTPCIHCGAEVKYHIDDSVLPVSEEISDLIKASRQRIASSQARISATRRPHETEKPSRRDLGTG